jgi:anti-sigma B factor antagonist
MASQLHIAQRRHDDVVVVSLSGRLVPDQEDLIFREYIDDLVAEGVNKIVVDLHDVVILDSGGVGVLVAKLLTLRNRGGDLRLARITERTARILAVTHLMSVFTMFDTVAEAVQSFSGSGVATSANARAAS